MTDKEVFMAAYQSNKSFYEALLRCLAISHGVSMVVMVGRVSAAEGFSPQFKDFCKTYVEDMSVTETIEF